MRRAIGSGLAVLLMALSLSFAAPSAHADPPPAQCSDGLLQQAACAAADVAGSIGSIVPGVGAVQAAAPAVGGAIDFVQNPLGYIAAAVQGVALGFMGWISTMSNQATQPDLSAEFWLQAYRTGMGIGVVLLGFVLLFEIVQVGRRKSSADDLIETLSIWVPAFFAGIIFGPGLAQFIVNGSGYLVDGLVRHLTGFGGTDAYNSISTAAANANWFSATGAVQALMALFVAIGVLVAAVVVFVSLCIQAVIIYLASAVFAIGWVFIVTNRHRENAWKIPRLIIGIAFGKALLFLLLGLALALATAATSFQGDGALRDFGLITMATIAMLLAAFAPLILLRHAPVIPGTGTSRHTQDSVVAASAGGRAAARGASTAKAGGSKMQAMVAARMNGKTAPTPPPGASAGPGRAIDPPVPASGTSKAGASRKGGNGSAATPTPTQPPDSPKPSSAGRPASARGGPTSIATSSASGSGGTRTPAAGRTGSGGSAGLPAEAPSNQATNRPGPRQPRGRQTEGRRPSTAGARADRSSPVRQPYQPHDHEYQPPTEPPEESE